MYAQQHGFQYYGRHVIDCDSGMPYLQALIISEIENQPFIIEYIIKQHPDTLTHLADGPRFWLTKQKVKEPSESIRERVTTLDSQIKEYFSGPNKT